MIWWWVGNGFCFLGFLLYDEVCLFFDNYAGATVVRVAGGRVRAAFSTLLVLAVVGNRGEKGVIVVVHHSGMFGFSFIRI